MSHTQDEKAVLVRRVRRIKGQVQAVEDALESGQGCSRVLQVIAACHGAINSLMVEVLREHLYGHVLEPKRKPSTEQVRSAEDLMRVVKSYLR